MKKNINVLLVDDEPSIIEAYSNFLNQYEYINPEYGINIITAMCCDSAVTIIKNRSGNPKEIIDIALVDMRLPQSKDSMFSSGEDIGVLSRKKFPKIKIIIITGYYETLVLSSIIQNVKPESMLFKGDIVSKTIFEAITKVLNNQHFYSATVLDLIHKKISSNINLDPINKLMLYELWKGTKTKDLVNCLPLSMGAIEKRKRNLRSLFSVKSKDDNALIEIILEKGFL